MSLMDATTTPRSDKNPVKVYVDPLHLNEIPDAMRKMGWNVAANLMNHWFLLPAFVMDDKMRQGEIDPLSLKPVYYNEDIVKMDWLLSYPSWKKAKDELYQRWLSPAGIKRLRDVLKLAGWRTGLKSQVKLGHLSFTARQCDKYSQINTIQSGGKLDTINGLLGAIGSGALKIAVVGSTFHKDGKDYFKVDQTGFYLRDTYDFNGDDEPLGYWNRERCLSKMESITMLAPRDPMGLSAKELFEKPNYVPVFNRDFRKWQKIHGKGGDFVVYSNVMWQQGPNLVIEL